MAIEEVAARVVDDPKIYLKTITPELYSLNLNVLFGASIGQHTRHFIEFFQCLFAQIEAGDVIDYSARKRDLELEENPLAAQKALEEIQKRLTRVPSNKPCQLKCSEHFSDEADVTVASNVQRELVYNIEHTIHHLAIIKIGLATLVPSIDLPEHFGVAPSTIRYKHNLCAQ